MVRASLTGILVSLLATSPAFAEIARIKQSSGAAAVERGGQRLTAAPDSRCWRATGW